MSETDVDTPMPKVLDPHNLRTDFVDWLASAGHFEGVVNLTFGTGNYGLMSQEHPVAPVQLTSKLRMSLDFAKRLHFVLGTIIAQADSEQAEAREQKNHDIFG